MELLSIGLAIDYVREVGGSLTAEAGRVKLRLPGNCSQEGAIVETIRSNRDAVLAMLEERENKAPSLDEVARMLPSRVRVVKYQPRVAPFAVAPVSVVTNAGKFYRTYLTDLRCRLEHPSDHAAAPLTEILAKLADAGLELAINAVK